jgi:hypothetical protein
MKKAMLIIIASCLAFTFICEKAWADGVNGYYRTNGTYVEPYYRSHPNRTVTDNYSFKGNVNPYTGREGNNYYRQNPTSPYYDGRKQYNCETIQYHNKYHNR